MESKMEDLMCQDDRDFIQPDFVDDTIRAYVRGRLQHDDAFEKWRSDPFVQKEIERELVQRAHGEIRLAECQLDTLQNCLDRRTLQKTLKSLPERIEEIYDRIVDGIDEDYFDYAIKLLQFLTYAERPLRLEEAVDILVVDPSRNPPFDFKSRMPNPRDITRICPSLVSLVEVELDGVGETILELQLAHFSVQQYLSPKRIDEDTLSENMSHKVTKLRGELHETRTRASITMICLAYLSHLAEECGTWGLCREQFPLAQYSAQYWMGHAKIAESEENVQKMILSFFLQQKQAYATWVELFDPWAQIYGGEMATPLYFASLANLRYTVENLLQRGADVHAQGGRYGPALQAASYQGHKVVVQLLLQKGANVNALGGKYGSALRAASSRGHEDVVQLLLEKGANANVGRDNALQDHKTLLLLLEKRNMRALMMAREEAKLFEGSPEDR